MEENKKEYYIVRIGENLKKCLDLQKEAIKKVTYNIIEVSDYNAGEVLAEKIFSSDLL